MGRVITIASAKGGVGKTTTALNLGFELGRFAGRVLLVDADPQGGLANASNVRAKNPLGLVDLVLRGRGAAEVVTPTRGAGLALVGFGRADDADQVAYEAAARDGRLSASVRELTTGYDYVLLDAPAGLGSITRALLEASQGVLIPVQARSLAVKTLPALLRLLGAVRDTANPGLELDGVVVTMLDYVSSAEGEIARSVRESLPADALFRKAIPRSGLFERASMDAIPVALLPDSDRVAQHYMDLALELKARELKRHTPEAEDEHAL